MDMADMNIPEKRCSNCRWWRSFKPEGIGSCTVGVLEIDDLGDMVRPMTVASDGCNDKFYYTRRAFHNANPEIYGPPHPSKVTWGMCC